MHLFKLTFVFITFLLCGCASKVLDYKDTDKLENNQEYETLVKVKEIPQEEPVEAAPAESEEAPEKKAETAKTEEVKAEKPAQPAPKKTVEKKKKEKKQATQPKKKKKSTAQMKRQPEIEDSEGFDGRRPLVDPFRVGEVVTLNMTYFNLTAGTMDLRVDPFVEVNGQKAYTFSVHLKTNSIFSRFYSVNDVAITHVDYETLVPRTHSISVKESKQLREIKSYFDFKKNKASYWETKVTKDKGEQSRKLEWDILPYSQNVISAIYYLRTFQLTPGKKLAFRVAEEGKNIVFTGEVLRRERIETEIGVLDTVVVKPKIEVDGVFKPMGEVLIWLTDDDRKFPVRIESKIKIGTIIAKLKSIQKGRP